MLARLVHGDGVAGMLDLEAGSVSLVVNDPPWGATRAAWDRELSWRDWWSAIDHALAPDGVLVCFASMRLAVKIIPIARRRFAYDLIWRKNRSSGYLNAKKAPLRKHETLLIFGDRARGRARYTPQFTHGHEPMHAATRISKSTLYGRETVSSAKAGETSRYASSVLDFDALANDTEARIHATQKPVDLLRWLVRAYSRPGELVADPTCGSGSLLHACRAEGRRSIGWESDAEIHARARAWLDGTDSPLFQRIA